MDRTERQRRNRAAYAPNKTAEAAQLGGWYRSGLWDGRSRDGRAVHGHIYSHPDGRQTFVFDDMYCSDPELQALLQARAEARAKDREVEPHRPWHWRAMDLLLRVVRAWVGRRHA